MKRVGCKVPPDCLFLASPSSSRCPTEHHQFENPWPPATALTSVHAWTKLLWQCLPLPCPQWVQKYLPIQRPVGESRSPNACPGRGLAHGSSPGHLGSLCSLQPRDLSRRKPVPTRNCFISTKRLEPQTTGLSLNWLSQKVANPHVMEDNCLCFTHAEAK